MDAEDVDREDGLEVVSLEGSALWSRTRAAGLSLADRACLALARRYGVPALTAERAWGDVEVGVQEVVVR